MSAIRRASLLTVIAAITVFAAPAAAMAAYASIAFNSNTGRFGLASGQPTKAAAEKAARSHCGGAKCHTVLWVYDECGVVVQRQKDGVYFAGIGITKVTARGAARKRAHAATAPIVVYVCAS